MLDALHPLPQSQGWSLNQYHKEALDATFILQVRKQIQDQSDL